MNKERFIDYYEILELSPNADSETIERVFRLLAKRYHPDNSRTGETERFSAITEAFRVLSNPEKRAAYDANYESERREQWSRFIKAPTSSGDTDRTIQDGILSLLYGTRRRTPSDPGMGIFELEKWMEEAEGQLEFHLWYLKEKGWIQRTESGKFAITVEGVDALATKNRFLRKDRLLTEGNYRPSEEGEEISYIDGWRALPHMAGISAR